MNKLCTFYIYALKELTMLHGITLMNPKHFKIQYNSCLKNIKTILYHCQIMFYHIEQCNQTCKQNCNSIHMSYNLLNHYQTQQPIIQIPVINQAPNIIQRRPQPMTKHIYI